jgi:hypothetical protein
MNVECSPAPTNAKKCFTPLVSDAGTVDKVVIVVILRTVVVVVALMPVLVHAPKISIMAPASSPQMTRLMGTPEFYTLAR